MRAGFSIFFRRVIMLSLLVTSLAGCVTSSPTIGTHIGKRAPEITLADGAGKMHALSDLHGKLILLEFWDAPNAEARRNHFDIQRLYLQYQKTAFSSGKGFTVYSVNLDTDAATWKQAIQEDGLTFPDLVHDAAGWNGNAVQQYGIGALPKYFLINENGIIINHNMLIPELERILNEQM